MIQERLDRIDVRVLQVENLDNTHVSSDHTVSRVYDIEETSREKIEDQQRR